MASIQVEIRPWHEKIVRHCALAMWEVISAAVLVEWIGMQMPFSR
jgi:hypothetical protein